MTFGLLEILVIVLVFLVLGPRRIADIVRSIGRGAQDFVENLGRDKDQKEIEPAEEEDPPSNKD
jgi:Sec-independent protein translocase protein TatA